MVKFYPSLAEANKPVIAVTMGDPAGIGPEICARALTSPEVKNIANCVVVGDRKSIRQGLKITKIDAIEINPIQKISEAKFLPGVIDIFDLNNVDINRMKLGSVSKAAGKAAVQYIEKAIDLAQERSVEAIVTAPINKEAINKAGYKFHGHTEILAARTHSKKYAMMFVSENFWVMLVTTHLPLREVSKNLNKDKVLKTIELAHATLSKLRGKKPRIGVAGLNPHAGEGGIFGDEEKKFITPAIEQARKAGINAEGPISPDAIFFLANSGLYDIVIAMYHDQGLIPLKLVSFGHSVNVTVGLPIIRTSVDHGTGFDIAGKGWANPSSLIEAIKVAAYFARIK
jgi:4-hydroxythreonine-4-phosphate dehydrogenase